MIFEDCHVTFQKIDNEEYNYCIYILNCNRDEEDEQNQDDEYFIPIRREMIIFKYQIQAASSQAVGFQWKFEDSWLQLQFEQGIDAELFEQLVCNLIFQTNYR